jgi:hypothetical protein
MMCTVHPFGGIALQAPCRSVGRPGNPTDNLKVVAKSSGDWNRKTILGVLTPEPGRRKGNISKHGSIKKPSDLEIGGLLSSKGFFH